MSGRPLSVQLLATLCTWWCHMDWLALLPYSNPSSTTSSGECCEGSLSNYIPYSPHCLPGWGVPLPQCVPSIWPSGAHPLSPRATVHIPGVESLPEEAPASPQATTWTLTGGRRGPTRTWGSSSGRTVTTADITGPVCCPGWNTPGSPSFWLPCILGHKPPLCPWDPNQSHSPSPLSRVQRRWNIDHRQSFSYPFALID